MSYRGSFRPWFSSLILAGLAAVTAAACSAGTPPSGQAVGSEDDGAGGGGGKGGNNQGGGSASGGAAGTIVVGGNAGTAGTAGSAGTGMAGNAGSAGTGPMPIPGPPYAFPQGYRSSHCTYPTGADPAQAKKAYDRWKMELVTSEGAGENLRVRRPNNEMDTTVSEGIAYGMIFSVVFGDQDQFDKLWGYARSHANDKGLVMRFLREARTASTLVHPNVVTILDMGTDPGGDVYLAMELLHGESLGEMLDREGTLSVERTIELLRPVMDALALAHRRGIIHRDIKPDNVVVGDRGDGVIRPILLDFGMAKALSRELSQSLTALTEQNMVFGTPEYMAPEQARGDEVDARCDVYAAGVILFAAERGTQAALDAIQLLGGSGYVNDSSAGRLLRDAKLYEIGAGTSEIRRMLIGRELVKGNG